MLTTNSSAIDPAASESPPAASACPPPLAWVDVLANFHKQAHAWYLDRPNYRLSGRTLGSGPPLYLLNGFAGTHELYSLFVWLLRDRYRCVLFDYPAPKAKAKVSLDDLADDLAAIAETSGDRNCRLFASSFGGLVTMTAMQRHPDRFERAVIQAGYAHRSLSRLEQLLIDVARNLPGRLRHFPGRGAIQRQNQRRWFPPFDATRWQFYFDNTGSVPLAELARRATIIRDCDLRPLLHGIVQPVLLVGCEGHGRILDNCQQELADGLPHATVEALNDTGQVPFLTHPHRLAKVVHAFLENAAGSGLNDSNTLV